jgi:hypothetical protein
MPSNVVIFLANIFDVEMEMLKWKIMCVCVCLCVCVRVCVGACMATNFGPRFIIPRKRAPIKPLQMTSSQHGSLNYTGLPFGKQKFMTDVNN